MKIFSTSQVRMLDQYTIQHEPIASIDLMERAALQLCSKYAQLFGTRNSILMLAGPGNNGGDALAMARLLRQKDYTVKVVLIQQGSLSADCQAMLNNLQQTDVECTKTPNGNFILPDIETDTIIIDGLFGSGLSRPLSGVFADAVRQINRLPNTVVSIDIPSGLQGEQLPQSSDHVVKADYTLSLQFPKLTFMLPETAEYMGEWHLLDIGIHPEAISTAASALYYSTAETLQPRLKTRAKFSHKGTYGHGLIVAGRRDMAGAAVLAAKAALRSGIGLATVHSAACNRLILQTTVPEAIFQSDTDDDFICTIAYVEKYNAIAFGPGIGTLPATALALEQALQTCALPCVLDADALNILSSFPHLMQLVPHHSILTPHPKEFDRLFGPCTDTLQRILKASEKAQFHQLIIVLKGAHTAIALPNGEIHFNSSGNAGMATAGSGDVLSGILVSLLAQKYTPEHAAILGVYLHGLAADIALAKQSEESLTASDITDELGAAFKKMRTNRNI